MTHIAQIGITLLFAHALVGAMRLKAGVAVQDEASPQLCETLLGVAPEQNYIHLLSSTYFCTDGDLRMNFSGSMSCREACGRNPECNFVSIWRAGGREQCKLTKGCRTKDQLNMNINPLRPNYLQIDVYGKRQMAAGALGEETFVWSDSLAGFPLMPPRWVKGKISEIVELGCAVVQVVEQHHIFETMLGPKPAFENTYAVSELQPKPMDSCELGPWKVLQGKEAYRDGDKLEVFVDANDTDDQGWDEAVFRKICDDGTLGIEWEDGTGEECKLPAHVKRAKGLSHFMKPGSIETCTRWCTEDVNCIGFRAASDSTTGGLIACEAIEKNGCFDPESVEWVPWPDQTVDLLDLQLRRARVLAVTDIPYDHKWSRRAELVIGAFAGDPLYGAKWEFHWKSDPMNLVTNDLASSGRYPPCRPPFEDHTEGSIYATHYKCKLRETVAFGGDQGRRNYNPRTIILNRDGTFDGNLMYIEAIRSAWNHLVSNEHLANEILNLFISKAKKQIVPIKEWFETYVVMKFLGFVAHAAAHGSAPYIFAKAGLAYMGVKAALAKFMLPIMVTYTVSAAIINHERQMDETDDKIKFVGCNSKTASLFLIPHRRAVIADELQVCGPSFYQNIQSLVSIVIDAQVEIFRRFERISECILSWGWEPPRGTPDIWQPGRSRSGTVACLSNVLLPGLMGIHGRPGLLQSALSLTVSWWQQNWRLLKQRQGARRDVHLQLSRIFELGLGHGEGSQAPWDLPEPEQRGACLALAASQEAFAEVFNHLAVAATYWVQTFGLYPSNGTIMQNVFHWATDSTVKCAGTFREYPSFAEPGQIYKPWAFCPAERHKENGDVSRFCNGNIDQFHTDVSRAARWG